MPPKEWVGMCTICFKDKQDDNQLFLVWLKSPLLDIPTFNNLLIGKDI